MECSVALCSVGERGSARRWRGMERSVWEGETMERNGALDMGGRSYGGERAAIERKARARQLDEDSLMKTA
jgi:hypothetical protein